MCALLDRIFSKASGVERPTLGLWPRWNRQVGPWTCTSPAMVSMNTSGWVRLKRSALPTMGRGMGPGMWARCRGSRAILTAPTTRMVRMVRRARRVRWASWRKEGRRAELNILTQLLL